jgi:hypothetical protein
MRVKAVPFRIAPCLPRPTGSIQQPNWDLLRLCIRLAYGEDPIDRMTLHTLVGVERKSPSQRPLTAEQIGKRHGGQLATPMYVAPDRVF